jgi:tRNA modification GTPase
MSDIPRRRDVAVAALLTPPGRGAVATIAVRGDLQFLDESPALFAAANNRAATAQPLDRVNFGRWGGDVPEDVIVCRTAPQELEIHCHGGAAAVRRLLQDLEERGCRVVSWQDFAAAGQSTIDAECTLALTQATTLRTARILLQQQSGLLRSAIEELRTLPLDGVVARTNEMLSWSEFGRHLTEPWQVVLCGLPNVGKSSLINALLGYSRSIVFDQPGTTRDVVTGQTAFDGWPVELSDTAGLRADADDLESAGIDRARERARSADLIVLVLDRSRSLLPGDHELLDRWPDAVRVAHKSDLNSAWTADMVPRALAVSSVSGEGLALLCQQLVRQLIPRVPEPDTPIPVASRQVQSLERIRQAAAAGRSDEVGAEVEFLLNG